MNMNTEPVRLPAWVAALIALALPVVIAWLNGADWKPALAGSVAALVPMLGAAEVARRTAYSPARRDADVAWTEAAVTAKAIEGARRARPLQAERTDPPAPEVVS